MEFFRSLDAVLCICVTGFFPEGNKYNLLLVQWEIPGAERVHRIWEDWSLVLSQVGDGHMLYLMATHADASQSKDAANMADYFG